MNTVVNTVIVGQGISGSLLAFELIEKNIDFLIIDNHHLHSSSKVAAGLYNPVVFRKPTLGFNVDNVLPFALEKYGQLERKLNVKFLHQRPYLKFFENFKTINDWEAKAGDPKFNDYINLPLLKHQINGVKNDLPFAQTKFTGNVDLPLFLKNARSYFSKMGALVASKVEEISKGSDFKLVLENGKEVTCEKVILARGYQEKDEPEFSFATVGATKGDILTISCPDLNCDFTLSKGFFIMPIGGGLYKVGATYDWEDKTDNPSESAKQELQKRFESLVSLPYTVVNHEAGLRPGAKDRRPLLGSHPENKNLFLFNGLGSKGVLLGPYYANQLVEHIFEGKILDEEVNIERMKKYYGNTED